VLQGVTPTLVGILPYSGVKFYTYQKLKRIWSTRQDAAAAACVAPARTKPPVYMSLLFGGCAGLVGQSVTYPLDIVRRRMQVSSDGVGGLRGMAAHLQALLAQYGYRGLFRGLSVNYIKVVPSTAVGFTVYDAVKHELHLENHL
jgi:Mitochondrial carrier protein